MSDSETNHIDPTEIQCSVCFATPSVHSFHNQIIRCEICKLTAHRFCYQPNTLDNFFICDPCKNNYNGKCQLCDNKGLLKCSGPKHYAHPICLLFNPNYLVDSYEQLSFTELERPKSAKKAKSQACQNCGNSSGLILRCSLKCNKYSHIYCAMKSYQSTSATGWRVSLSLDLKSYANIETFEQIIFRYLKSQNKLIYKNLGFNAKSIKPVGSWINIYCEPHGQTLIECHCKALDEEKTKWIYCQNCCRWEHEDCVQLDSDFKLSMKNQEVPFTCLQCVSWSKLVQQNKFKLLQGYPKMHIYDYVYIHHYFETKSYQLSSEYLDFLSHIPILPSIIYAETKMKQTLFEMLKPKIDFDFFKAQLNKKLKDLNQLWKLFETNKQKVELIYFLASSKIINWGKNRSEFFVVEAENTNKYDLHQFQELVNLMLKFQKQYFYNESKLFKELLIRLNNKFEEGAQNEIEIKRSNKQLKSTSRRKEGEEKSTKDRSSKRQKVSHKDQEGDRQKSYSRIKNEELSKKERVENVNRKPALSAQTLLDELRSIIKRLKTCELDDKKKHFIRQDFIPLIKQIVTNSEIQIIFQEYLDNNYRKSRYLKPFGLFERKDQVIDYLEITSLIKAYEQKTDLLFKAGFDDHHQADKIRQIEQCRERLQYFLQNTSDEVRLILEKQIKELELNEKLYTKKWELSNQITIKKPLKLDNLTLDQLNATICQTLCQNNELVKQNLLEFYALKRVIKFTLQSKFMPNDYKICENIAIQIRSKLPYHLPTKMLEHYENLYVAFEKIAIAEDILRYKFEGFLMAFKMVNPSQANLLTFFLSIKEIPLQLFHASLTFILRDKFIFLLEKFLKRSDPFQTEQCFQTMSYWHRKLNICNPLLQSIVTQDTQFRSKIMFRDLNFDNPKFISGLSQKLDEGLELYERLRLTFRLNKIRTLCRWISLYKSILNIFDEKLLLPSTYWTSENSQNTRADFIELKLVYDFMVECKFPECNFLNKLKGFIDSGEKYQAEIKTILSSCNWSENQLSDSQKLSLSNAETLIKKLKTEPFKFEAQQDQIEIVMQEFKKESLKADELAKIKFNNQNMPQSFLINVQKSITQLMRYPFSYAHLDKLKKMADNSGTTAVTLSPNRLSSLPPSSKQFFNDRANDSQQLLTQKQMLDIFDIMIKKPRFLYCSTIEEVKERLINMKSHIPEKEHKIEYINNNLLLMEHFTARYKNIFVKFQRCHASEYNDGPFTRFEIQKLEELVRDSELLPFIHEQAEAIDFAYKDYKYVLRYQKNCSNKKGQQYCFLSTDLIKRIDALPSCFLTQQLKKCRGKLQGQINRYKKQ